MEKKNSFEELEDGTVVYDILGKEFEVTSQLDTQLKVEKQFNARMDQIIAEAKQIYQKLGSLDALAKNLPGMLCAWRDQVLDEGVNLLMSYGIYEYDRRRLMGICRGFNESGLESQYGAAISRCIDEPERLISDIVENNEKIKSQGDPKLAKQMSVAVYKHTSTETSVYNGYGVIYMRIMLPVQSVLKNAGLMAEYEYDSAKADAIRENCMKISNISRQQERELFWQAFEADPLNANVIETALVLKLDDSGGLTEYAKRYGFYDGFLIKQKQVLEKKYEKAIKAISDCTAIADNNSFFDLVRVCATMQSDGLDTSEYLSKIVNLRTAAELDEEDVKELSGFLKEMEGPLGCAITSRMAETISKAQVQQEIDSRTVNSVVYGTREEAEQAAEEVKRLRNLFSGRSATAGFSMLMEQDIRTLSGQKEYEEQEKALIKNYREDWRTSKIQILLWIAALVITVIINPLLTLLAIALWIALSVNDRRKRREFERLFRIEGDHIVKR